MSRPGWHESARAPRRNEPAERSAGVQFLAAPQRILLRDAASTGEKSGMNQRLYAYPFADIYSLYVAKVERKGRSLEAFFAQARDNQAG